MLRNQLIPFTVALALVSAACDAEVPAGGGFGAIDSGAIAGNDGSTGSLGDGGNNLLDGSVSINDGGGSVSDGAAGNNDGSTGGGNDGSTGGGNDGSTGGGNDGSTGGGNDGSSSGGNDGSTGGGNDGSTGGGNDGSTGGGNDGSTSDGNDGSAGGGNDGSTGGGNDGSTGGGNDGSTGGGNDGSTGGGNDGSTGGGNDGGVGGGNDGSTGGGNLDGGSLGQPQSEFCQGTGAVVEVGGAGECSGTIAQNIFRFAVCTCEQLSVQSNLSVDAFDSRDGPYGAATSTGTNILNDGHVGVNGLLNLAGKLTALGSVFVSGGGFSVGAQSSVSINVYTAGDAVQVNSFTSIGRNAFVQGDVSGRYNIANDLYVTPGATVDPQTNVAGSTIVGALNPVTPCPCDPSEILDIQSIIDYGAQFNDNASSATISATTWSTGTGPDNIDLPCGRYYLQGIFHTRSLTIRALGRTVLYVDGDINVGGSLRIEVAPGAEMDLFVAGSLLPQAALRFGDPEQPSAFRTYVAGSNTIFINASSEFGGNLYAPNADVSFGASANLFGSLFCRNAFFSGQANVHFDRSIRSASDDCNPDGGVGGDAGVNDGGGADAGVIDSGAPGCTQCFDCQNGQACLNPPGGGGGTCGPCVTDLDCCPTEICVAGFCTASQ